MRPYKPVYQESHTKLGLILVRVFAAIRLKTAGLFPQGYCIHPHPVDYSVLARLHHGYCTVVQGVKMIKREQDG